MKKSTRLPVFQRIAGISLTTFAADLILARAEVVSEGETERLADETAVYRGSTLLTLDLDHPDLDMPRDAPTRERFRRAAECSIMLHIGLLRLSRKEAERRAYPKFIREMRADTAFRVVDNRLMIDIDIECPLADMMGTVEAQKESGGR